MKYTLQQCIFLYNSYVRKKFYKSCKEGFIVSILFFLFGFLDDCEIS
jgi:hypothetical protein